MPDKTLVKLKTGALSQIRETENGNPVVSLDEGAVYFAIDVGKKIGKILYDAPYENENNQKSIERISMNGFNDTVHYGECTSAGNASGKTVACPDFKLIAGARVIVYFGYTNTASNLTLNVEHTGSYPILYEGVAISPSVIVQQGTYEFVFGTDGN